MDRTGKTYAMRDDGCPTVKVLSSRSTPTGWHHDVLIIKAANPEVNGTTSVLYEPPPGEFEVFYEEV